jgi:hypothetical protein
MRAVIGRVGFDVLGLDGRFWLRRHGEKFPGACEAFLAR